MIIIIKILLACDCYVGVSMKPVSIKIFTVS